jgi:hypothetical protein
MLGSFHFPNKLTAHNQKPTVALRPLVGIHIKTKPARDGFRRAGLIQLRLQVMWISLAPG